MAKRMTIKEIAREVGFSIATVSYVLNGRDNQKISEPTKKKILQYANLYHYRGNAAARSLASGKYNSTALIVPPSTCLLSEANEALIAKRLVSAFQKIGCHILIGGDGGGSQLSGVDAIAAVGLSKESFMSIASNNLTPIIAFDSFVSDPLFNEVVDSFEGINGHPPLLALPIACPDYRKYLNSYFSVHEVRSAKEAISLANSIGPSVFYARDPALERLFAEEGYPCRFIDSFSSKKMEALIATFEAVRSETPPTAETKRV